MMKRVLTVQLGDEWGAAVSSNAPFRSAGSCCDPQPGCKRCAWLGTVSRKSGGNLIIAFAPRELKWGVLRVGPRGMPAVFPASQ